MITIDKEFQSLIPPLSEDEFRQLEENCVKDGIRDALITWPQPDGTEILIDGHNRWNISVKHGGIRFDTKRIEFKSREDAKQWIILNQFGRRNLSAYDRSLLALKLKPLIAEKAKEKEHDRKTTYQKSEKSSLPKHDTTKELAKIAGVSHDTIHKVEQIEKHATPDIKRRVREGNLSINQGFLSTRPKQDMKAQIEKAKEEHKDFLESKKDSPIIDLRAVSVDESNQKLIAHGLMSEVERILNTIEAFSFKHKPSELSDIRKVLTKEEMDCTIDRLGKSISALQIIRNGFLKEVNS
jgi:hypothetical protein